MWKRTSALASREAAPEPPPNPEQRMWLSALRSLAGAARGVVYDVPAAGRPHRQPGRLYLRGSEAWTTFLDARERMDRGELTVLIALRPLDDDEAHLVVDWGSTYANTFLLVEPGDPRCDLTTPDNHCAVRVRAATITTLRSAPPPAEQTPEWMASTPLIALLRQIYGTWVYWTAPPPEGSIQRVPLDLSRSSETLGGLLIAQLNDRFTQDTFNRELVRLHFWERELVWGPVPRARSVFKTRLGMPVLLDPYSADRAVRHLVNRGRLTVTDPARPRAAPFGMGHPVPGDMADEAFARLVVA
jgi:hypothetical protein